MKTYPHVTDDGIIELVRKDEHDEVVAELENRVTFFVDANYEIANERNKLRSDNAKLLQRLEDARQSHLHASARNVQTIQRQSVLLDRLAQLVDDASEKADDGDIFKTEWETQARAALAAYESAKKGEQP